MALNIPISNMHIIQRLSPPLRSRITQWDRSAERSDRVICHRSLALPSFENTNWEGYLVPGFGMGTSGGIDSGYYTEIFGRNMFIFVP